MLFYISKMGHAHSPSNPVRASGGTHWRCCHGLETRSGRRFLAAAVVVFRHVFPPDKLFQVVDIYNICGNVKNEKDTPRQIIF